MNRVKIKEKASRDAALRGEFFSFQDQTLAAHFPQAESVSCSQHKRAHKDLNGNGGSSLGGRTSLGGSTLTTPPGHLGRQPHLLLLLGPNYRLSPLNVS